MTSEELIPRVIASTDTEWIREMALRYMRDNVEIGSQMRRLQSKQQETEKKLDAVVTIFDKFLSDIIDAGARRAERNDTISQDDLDAIQMMSRKRETLRKLKEMPLDDFISSEMRNIMSDPEQRERFMKYAREANIL